MMNIGFPQQQQQGFNQILPGMTGSPGFPPQQQQQGFQGQRAAQGGGNPLVSQYMMLVQADLQDNGQLDGSSLQSMLQGPQGQNSNNTIGNFGNQGSFGNVGMSQTPRGQNVFVNNGAIFNGPNEHGDYGNYGNSRGQRSEGRHGHAQRPGGPLGMPQMADLMMQMFETLFNSSIQQEVEAEAEPESYDDSGYGYGGDLGYDTKPPGFMMDMFGTLESIIQLLFDSPDSSNGSNDGSTTTATNGSNNTLL